MILYTPLQKTLKDKELSVEQLIEMLNANQNLKTQLNQGKYLPLKVIDEICDTLDVSVDQVILFRKGEQQGDIKVKVNWDNLLKYAKEKSLGLTNISTLIHLDRTYLSHAKTRNTNVPLGVLKRISILLKCNLDELKYKSELEECYESKKIL